jgi:hypothetical protein
MKLVLKDALQEYGVTGDTISMGENADWASALNSLTPKQQQQVGAARCLHCVCQVMPPVASSSSSEGCMHVAGG